MLFYIAVILFNIYNYVIHLYTILKCSIKGTLHIICIVWFYILY